MPRAGYLAKKLVCPVCSKRSLRTRPIARGRLHFTCTCGYSAIDDAQTLSLLARVQQDTLVDGTIPVSMKLKISDAAWDYLSQIAQGYGWIRSINTITSPGTGSYHINRFLMALSTVITWHDARPETYQGSGLWYDGGPLMQHSLNMSANSITAFTEIAYTHKIPPRNVQALILNEMYGTLAPTSTQYGRLQATCKQAAFAGAVIEAAGLRYLRPEAWPMAPTDLYKHKKGYGHPRADSLAVHTQRLYG